MARKPAAVVIDAQSRFHVPDATDAGGERGFDRAASSRAVTVYNAELQARFYPGTTKAQWLAYFDGSGERPNAVYVKPTAARVAVVCSGVLIRHVGEETVVEQVRETVWRAA